MRTNQFRYAKNVFILLVLFSTAGLVNIYYVMELELKNYLSNITHELSTSLKSGIKIDCPELYFNIDITIPLGLIVDEITSNSLNILEMKMKV